MRQISVLLTIVLFCLSARAEIGQVVASGLNCRARTGTWSTRYGTFDPGQRVRILGRHGGWLRVKCPNGRVGYVLSRYIRQDSKVRTAESPLLLMLPHSADTQTKKQPQVIMPSGCYGRRHRASRVTYYSLPVFHSFHYNACHRIEGACLYRVRDVEMIYNVGRGSHPVSEAECPHGYGPRGNCLNPCKSVAADARYHHIGEILYFPALRGKICHGQVEDGYVRVDDVGSAIRGPNRFDFYWGECLSSRNGICHDGSRSWGDPNRLADLLSRSTYYSCPHHTLPDYNEPPPFRYTITASVR